PHMEGDAYDRSAGHAFGHRGGLPRRPGRGHDRAAGTVAQVVEVGLPEDGDYATTVARPEFARATRRIRGLLGAASAAAPD
ncbi:MAG TPA: hypothetical protein VE198_25005, partial [Actinoallomurus sp.]|nr:hypothetical protein [Actinoallomurus sp.]